MLIKNIVKMFTRRTFSVFSQKHKNEIIQARRVRPWFKDKGDETLRLNYKLTSNSIVFDLGGYKGDFARDIYCKYSPKIYVFEPIPRFFRELENRFSHNSNILCFNFGLADTTRHCQIGIADNGSSIFKSNNSVQVQLVSFCDFIRDNNINHIDLIKINIEGAEYDLLEKIIEENLHKKIKNIQVQFHDFVVPNAQDRMKNIQSSLAKTHTLTYQYEFVWENWLIKENREFTFEKT